jgi:hypothetical protein
VECSQRRFGFEIEWRVEELDGFVDREEIER